MRQLERLPWCCFSDSARKGLRWLALVPQGGSFERLEGPCAVEMDHGVELLGQTSAEIVGLTLRFGPVGHPDRPLQARGAKTS